jgi:ABC-2 type transport system ATP-binding protein
MRQRCKLAMSLVHDPEILILDEPTVGLDPPGRHQLLSLIRDLRDEGRKILLSTHILHDAEFLCDELLLLEGGAVAYCGPVSHLVTGGAGRMVAEVIDLGQEFVDQLNRAGIESTPGGDGRLVFTSRGDDDLRTFWKLAAEQGREIRHLARESTSLEDAVVRVMEDHHV